jgi:deoxyribodipyrimidine photo-lyase
MSYSVVWFKRDLRVVDHEALALALRAGPVLCIYLVEPSLLAQPDVSRQHHRFAMESVADLRAQLRMLGLDLHVITGEAVAVLDRLHQLQPWAALYSHQETGNAASYERDKAVARWCLQQQLPWHQPRQQGVVRGPLNRDYWQRQWQTFVHAPCVPEPSPVPSGAGVALPWSEPPVPSDDALGLPAWCPAQRQLGGRARAVQVLHSFVADRAVAYRGGISSPLSAPDACSRLSPYLSWGCVSVREVVHTCQQAWEVLPPGRHRDGLRALVGRLAWRDHFIQKLETQPDMEWRNLHRGYNGLREPHWQPSHFQALQDGRTGWPMVDACVAMLRHTGWLNFRMRAMLVSVAAYPLWLHWRDPGHWLARQFLDYEPGIHWSQMQMQSGTTGINTTRVYNPVKQAQDHDPDGVFVRHWLPELRRVPDSWLLQPWRMPPSVQQSCGVQVGRDWPEPLVDIDAATRQAKAALHQRRQRPEVRATKQAIVVKHGSRSHNDRSPAPRSAPQRNTPEPQLKLFD